ncbi:SLOG family protein [Larkinella sp. GY13]|uniref:SLOG family protein n=1 Tax=Larkinella sp. GY13 TaxID=3453720 RepID=UPI003EE9F56D
MKTAIIGSRTATDASYETLKQTADELGVTEIISGGATGADTLAERYAQETGKPLTVFKADWNHHGKAAGPIRNRQIIEGADLVLALWDGQSKGTADSLKKAKALGKRTWIIWI